MSKKKFEELDLMDNFLVLALASDLEGGPAYGRLLAEGLLHEKVAHVRVHAEKIIPGSNEMFLGCIFQRTHCLFQVKIAPSFMQKRAFQKISRAFLRYPR